MSRHSVAAFTLPIRLAGAVLSMAARRATQGAGGVVGARARSLAAPPASQEVSR